MQEWIEKLESVRNNYVVAGEINKDEYVVPINELDCLINDMKANPIEPQVMQKIAEMIDEYRALQSQQIRHDDVDDYGDVVHNEEWWRLEISINTLNKLKEKLSKCSL